jgi:hypothetical protein
MVTSSCLYLDFRLPTVCQDIREFDNIFVGVEDSGMRHWAEILDDDSIEKVETPNLQSRFLASTLADVLRQIGAHTSLPRAIVLRA